MSILTHSLNQLSMFTEGDASSSGQTEEDLAAAEAAQREPLEADNRGSAKIAGAVACTVISAVSVFIIGLDAISVLMKMEHVNMKTSKISRVPNS